MHDVIVIGGGSAGLGAAMVLGRARRDTLVLDAGRPRNAPAPEAHGVFTRDGTPPLELIRLARAQLAPYPAVALADTAVTEAAREEGGFVVRLADGSARRARRLLLAFGVRDELPDIPGVAEAWGTRALHCGYCHGWEVADQPLAWLAGDNLLDQVALLRGWSRELLVCPPADGLRETDRAGLARAGVSVAASSLRRVEPSGEGLDLVFADGSIVRRRALFLRPPQVLRSPLAGYLGCELTEAGLIRTQPDAQTSVPGVFAAGDAGGAIQQVTAAAASGAIAAMAINKSLASEDFSSRS